MEDYIKKAADAFLVERPYGMRVDYRKGGYVLFNRNLNVLGNKDAWRNCLWRILMWTRFPWKGKS